MGAAASVGGMALLHSEPMAKHLLASTAVGWALVRELRQSGKEMESSGTSCGAVCLPVLLRVFYFFFFFPPSPPPQIYIGLLPLKREEPCGSWNCFKALQFL